MCEHLRALSEKGGAHYTTLHLAFYSIKELFLLEFDSCIHPQQERKREKESTTSASTNYYYTN